MGELIYSTDQYELRLEHDHQITTSSLPFFHTAAFCNRIAARKVEYYNLYESNQVIASLAFEIVGGTAINLPRSPYGGLITSSKKIRNIDWYVQKVTNYLTDRGLPIEVRVPSDIIYTEQSNFVKSLSTHGFLLTIEEVNQHIAIDQSDLQDKINRNRRRNLHACKDSGFLFRQLDKNSLEAAHSLIVESREHRGYPVTMTLAQLSEAFSQFPDNYKLFGVLNEDKLIAVAVSIHVTDQILYNFYHGDNLSYREYSPVTMLVEGIYNFCQNNGYQTLDLGISSDQGVLNNGLYQFKQSFGAIDSMKISYEYHG